ncbi:hypothetical protein IWW39_004795 [Coemansia spiralis]|uniref:Methyltransferase domain-containing protein n=1 Tax=Coemansia spiralis TaxID=417178 RepID=A0A9W8GG75_9FUNG|nr:hypothetical protein IWW39_004795 [Coemansia spiralis]
MAVDNGIELPDGFSSASEYVAEVRRIYSPYAFLAQMHIVDFLVRPHWESLDAEWRSYFMSDEFDIGKLIPMAAHGQMDEACPSSLREFVGKMFSLQFPRQRMGDQATGEERELVLKYFVDGMSEKKREEVVDLAALVGNVARGTGSGLVVDVGAGQGYLSRVVAYGRADAPRVLAVDFAEGQKRGAEVHQRRTLKRLQGKRAVAEGFKGPSDIETRLVHRVLRVDLESARELATAAQEEAGGAPWMLCGLHACGDLSSSVLKAFAGSDAAAVVVVPCCYNHITEGDGAGFPLSSELHGVEFGINALKTACQATVRWESREQDTVAGFQRNYFRALLHYLMVTTGQLPMDAPFPAVGGVTGTELAAAEEHVGAAEGDDRAFAAYAYAALKRLGVEWRPTVAQCVEARQRTSHGYRQMAVVWTLRSLMGPLIEGMLVVDRALYLRRHCGPGGGVRAFALFDAVTSPRNVVLAAWRGGRGGSFGLKD